MFFPEKIKSLTKKSKVLEIGPGSMPHPKATTILEKKFRTEEEAFAQAGYKKVLYPDGCEVVFYHGGVFPFKDNEFDYVICSHVIEHVPFEELDLFVSELCRVAAKGYIEFPTVFYELINFQPVHLWLMNFRDGKILFLDKKLFNTSSIHLAFRELIYSADNLNVFKKYKDFFFCGFEWENKIDYRMAVSLDDLVIPEEIEKHRTYFKNTAQKEVGEFDKTMKSSTTASIIKNIVRRMKRIIMKKKQNQPYTINSNAILENMDLIKIGENSEIKEYVIIKTYKNEVIIGEYTQINPFTVIYGGSGVKIGNNVMIATHCSIAAGNHNYKQIEKPMRFAGGITDGPIVIEDDVWIGSNVTITDGVRICKGAVVGANSVVTKNVAEFDVVAGVPAKVIGSRQNYK